MFRRFPAISAVPLHIVTALLVPEPNSTMDFMSGVLPDGVINSRSTTATVTDCYSIVRTAKINEARFEGLRRVENLNAGAGAAAGPWAGSTFTAGGGTVSIAWDVLTMSADSSVGGRAFRSPVINLVAGRTYVAQFEVLTYTGTATVFIDFFSIGVAATLLSAPSSVGAPGIYTTKFTPTVTGFANMRVGPGSGATAPYNCTCTVRNYMVEDVTGQSNQNPSEFVSMNAIRRNIVSFSESFDNAAWTKSGSGSGVTAPAVTPNAAVAPDGTTTADRVNFSAVSASPQYSQINRNMTGLTNGGTYTLSVYLKGAVGGETIYLMWTPNGVAFTSLAVTLTTDWQRFELPKTTGTASYIQIGVDMRDATQTAKAAQVVDIWGAQVELAATASAYQKVTDASAIDFNNYHGAAVDGVKYFATANGNTVVDGVVVPGTGVALTSGKGLLREPQRTNLIINNVSMVSLTTSGISKKDAAVVAPDRAITTKSIQEDSSAGPHSLLTTGIGAAGTYTISCRAKIVTGTRNLSLVLTGATAGAYAIFDLATGTLVTTGAAGTGWTVVGTPIIEAAEQGFWKVQLTVLMTSAATIAYELASGLSRTYAGDGTSEIAIWGAQVEAGTEASSTILTAGVALARGGDVTYAALPASYDQSQGTWSVEYAKESYNATTQRILGVVDAGNVSPNRMFLELQPSTTTLYLIAGGVSQVALPITTPGVAGSVYKTAWRYKTNDTRLTSTGSTAASDVLCTMSTVLNTIAFGTDYATSPGSTVNIRRVKYWNTPLSDANLDKVVA